MAQDKQKKTKQTGKERRAALREEKKKMTAAKALVDRAKAKVDPLDELSIPLTASFDGFEAVLSCKCWDAIDEDTRDWILKLEETNVKELYEKSDWGWDPKKKKEEMTEEEARYLIARTSDGKPIGFSHFRFDMDFDDEVVYCYELQIEESARCRGLGAFMLSVLEALTKQYNMKKTMLTVFKHNKRGLNFFKKQGYKLDETSLEDDEERSFCYEIYSKFNESYKPPAI